MNLVDLLRRYAGQSLHPTGGTHTPAQTSALLLLKPGQAAQPSEAELPTHNNAEPRQMPHAFSTATIDRAPMEPGAENSAIVTQPLTQSFELPPVTPTWQEQLAVWPQERRDLWDERAAIMEYEGHLARDDAERQALSCCEMISRILNIGILRDLFTEADYKVGHPKASLMIGLTNSWCVTSSVSADRLHGCDRLSWQHLISLWGLWRVECSYTSMHGGGDHDTLHYGASRHPDPRGPRGAARHQGAAGSEGLAHRTPRRPKPQGRH